MENKVEKMHIKIEFDCTFDKEESRLGLVGGFSHFFEGYDLEITFVEEGKVSKPYNIKHYLA